MANKPKDQNGADASSASDRDLDAVEAESVADATPKKAAADPDAEDATVLSETAPAQEAREAGPSDETPEPATDEAEPLEEAAETTPESAPAEPTRTSGMGALLYGLIGAVLGGGISLLGAGFLGQGDVPQEEIATKALVSSALEARVAELEKALRAEIDRVGAKSAALEKALAERAAADQTAAAERKALSDADATTNDALAVERTRITRLNEELVARERERAAAVSAMREQVSSLAAAVTATPSGGLAGESAGAPAAAGSATRLALLEGGLRRIEARVNGLSSEALPTPDLTRIDKLEVAVAAQEARLDQVERQARSAVKGEAAIGVAFAALAEAAAGSAPYAAPLETLRKTADLKDVDPALSGPAETGLPSKTALASRFDAAATQALKAAAKDRAAKGEGGVADRLTGLFTLRRVEEPGVEAMDDSAILARAEARIDEGDVAASLQELAALPEAGRAAMDDWIKDAERRVAAEAALSELRARLLGVE